MGGAWLVLFRRGEVSGRDGFKLGVALAVIYLPWLPMVLSQAAHTAAPWAERPSPLLLLGFAGGLFRYFALPLLAIAVFFAIRHHPTGDHAVRVLTALAVATTVLAWLCSQIEPAWATRYLAVVLGPLLLASGCVLSPAPR